ncbi:MAG: DUF1887 family CARF protein [Methanolobus sp.]|nr:DUF1887 family CARF protein [Methanolobus sp.]
MKVLINILSEQRLQNYIAIKHVKPDKVFTLSTEAMHDQNVIFSKVSGVKHIPIKCHGFDYRNLFSATEEIAQKVDRESEVVINYTGGTKIMSTALILRCLTLFNKPINLIYVNTRDHKIEKLTVKDKGGFGFDSDEIRIKIDIHDCFLLKGEQLKYYSTELDKFQKERFALSEQFISNKALEIVLKNQKDFFNGKEVKPKFSEQYGPVKYPISVFFNQNEFAIDLGEEGFRYSHPDGGKYLTGGWLEEYVYIKLLESGKFDEVAKNILIDFKSTTGNLKNIKNEIDVAVSKDVSHIFIECKAGEVKQEHLYKLKSLRDYFLGTYGKAFLVSRKEPKPNIKEKAKDLNIELIYGKNILNIEKLIK